MNEQRPFHGRARAHASLWRRAAAALALGAATLAEPALTSLALAQPVVGAVVARDGDAPLADAGGDVTAAVGVPIWLDGAQSFDPRGGRIRYAWSVLAAPVGSRPAIDGTDPMPVFTPDLPGRYRFALEVIGEDGLRSTPAELVVTVDVAADPAGVELTFWRPATVGARIDLVPDPARLDPRGSFIGSLPAARWSIVARPSASRLEDADITGGDTVLARVAPDVPGTYVFRVELDDGTTIDAHNVVVRAEPAQPGSERRSDVAPAPVRSLAENGDVPQAAVRSMAESSATPPATARPTVAGDTGSVTPAAAAAATLPLARLVDFSIGARPSLLRVAPGESGRFTVDLAAREGFVATPQLGVTGLPSAVAATFSAPALARGERAALTITVDADAVPGRYPLLVTAVMFRDGISVVRSVRVTLQVARTVETAAAAPAGPVCSGADLSGVRNFIYVGPEGVDRAQCGNSVVNACASIRRGIESCSGDGCTVVVGYGSYTTNETIVLRDGVSVYGGCRFDAGSASDSIATHYRTVVRVNPPPGAPAVSADGIGKTTRFHGLVVLRADETAKGTANVAMRVAGSKGLAIARSLLVAGRGGDGAEGVPVRVAESGGDGEADMDVDRGGGGGAACPTRASGGAGAGGQGAERQKIAQLRGCFITCYCDVANPTESTGRDGAASGPVAGGKGGGAGGAGCGCSRDDGVPTGTTGQHGASGTCGIAGGLPAASLFGAIAAGHWAPGTGGAGAAGDVGSGAGGGGAGGLSTYLTIQYGRLQWSGLPGGGGGGGGCGGTGGNGGQQGGASIALLLVDAVLAEPAVHSAFVPGQGGTGGRGGQGGAGGSGGKGGAGGWQQQTPIDAVGDCSANVPGLGGSGGTGGPGGAGGGGAGGNGGPAVGIAFAGNSANPGEGAGYLGVAGAPGGSGPGGRNAPAAGIDPSPCTGAEGKPGAPGGNARTAGFGVGGAVASLSSANELPCTSQCAGKTLDRPNFTGQDLRGADFTGAQIYGGIFIDAKLAGAKFDGALFGSTDGFPELGADFSGADLTGASFAGAKFKQTVYFTDATIGGANFSEVDLLAGPAVFGPGPLRCTRGGAPGCTAIAPRVRFTSARMSCEFIDEWRFFDLTEADLSACKTRLAGRNFDGAILAGVRLQNTNLDGASFVKADLRQITLSGASLACLSAPGGGTPRCVDMSGARLNSATLDQANLSGANLHGADLSNLPGNDAAAAKVRNAQLRNVNLADANLDGVDFTSSNFFGDERTAGEGCKTREAGASSCSAAGGADKSGFTCGCATAFAARMSGTQFPDAFLYGVDFGSAKMAGVNLRGAVLTGADFRATSIGADAGTGTATSFMGAHLQGTNLDQATITNVDLSSAFVDFAEGNSLYANLAGVRHNIFACSVAAKCQPAAGEDVCLLLFYEPTSVPGQSSEVTCPDGKAGPCGAPAAPAPNPRWKSPEAMGAVTATGTPGWYRRAGTYVPAGTAAAICGGRGPSVARLRW